ncbi:MAG: carbamoyltransferase HypF [Anaerolineales bacterium]
MTAARAVTVTGVVQGVGFRPFVYGLATRLGLTGWVFNHSGGVDIHVEGEDERLDAFVAALTAEAPPLARIERVRVAEVAPAGWNTFEIRQSRAIPGQSQLISPDVATCDDCLRELLDPHDRRYLYPFINCTNCGPRFTIIQDIPYDRPNTTMSVFPLCPDCQREYADPRDRRFHAQPNACPVCGPHLWLVDGQGRALVASPTTADNEAVVAAVRERLARGEVVAIKGLGGFHLACDATNAAAVATLRARKRRPHKAFAVMVATLEEARALAQIDEAAAEELTSARRPVVLVERHADTPLAEEVAPGTGVLGLMLPSTPLHHLITRDVGRPLVMTSGNLSEEPIAKDNDEAIARLGGLADAILLHNRDIHSRYDDSVIQATGLREFPLQVSRRARGLAPYPVSLPLAVPPLLAVGPLLKNTFCLARDRYAFVSQHIGDLEDVQGLAHYRETLVLYERLFRLQPAYVVRDLHPDYLSSRIALAYAAEHGLAEPLAVQHHRAHVAAVLADNAWRTEDGPVVGVAMDGTGLGDDGAIWGGEWLVGNEAGLERRAHLAYLPLPGGEVAIRQPWRIAAAYNYALLGAEQTFTGLPEGLVSEDERALLLAQLARGVHTPQTSSMGRLFDAVSALLGLTTHASYEAQAAIALEQAALRAGTAADQGSYPWDWVDEGEALVVELGGLWSALSADVRAGVASEVVALRFHRSVANMVVQLGQRLAQEAGTHTIALSGGCWQNALLLRLTVPALRACGLQVLLHREVPCNDGGVSLGQAALAGVQLGA